MSVLSRFYPRSAAARSAWRIATGTAIGQAIALLASPILTRLYAPEDFGVLAVYGSIIAVLVTASSLRYEIALPLVREPVRAYSLLALCFGVLLITTGTSTGLLLLFRNDLFNWLGAPALRNYLWLVPVGLFGTGTYQVLSYWAIRSRSYESLARTKVAQGLFMTTTQIGVAAIHPGPLGLLLGEIVGRTAGITVLSRLALPVPKQVHETVTRGSIREEASQFRRFPIYSAGASIAGILGQQTPLLMIAALYGPHVAGSFAFSQRIVSAPLTLIGRSVDQVYLGEGSAIVQSHGPSALRQVYVATALKLLVIGGLPTLVACLSAPLLFEWLFGSEWVESGIYTRLISVAYFAQIIVSPLSQTLNLIEQQHLQLAWDIVRLVLSSAAIYTTYALGGPAIVTIAVYSVVLALAYGCHMLLVLFALRSKR